MTPKAQDAVSEIRARVLALKLEAERLNDEFDANAVAVAKLRNELRSFQTAVVLLFNTIERQDAAALASHP